MPGEDDADYAALAACVVDASGPRDAIEEFLVRDVIDLSWEVLRLRRAKAGILRASIGNALSQALRAEDSSPLGSFPFTDPNAKLIESWASGDAAAQRKVTALLAKAGMTFNEVTAMTFDIKLDSIERLDRSLASTEARRNNALREIDRHRAALGAAVRQSIDDVEDADFRDVETGEISTGAQP
jgi:hypothetical protein